MKEVRLVTSFPQSGDYPITQAPGRSLVMEMGDKGERPGRASRLQNTICVTCVNITLQDTRICLSSFQGYFR